jgi:hypothetical protein
MDYQPTHSRHEVAVQKLRIERKNETQRLEKLKARLKARLDTAPQNRSDDTNNQV